MPPTSFGPPPNCPTSARPPQAKSRHATRAAVTADGATPGLLASSRLPVYSMMTGPEPVGILMPIVAQPRAVLEKTVIMSPTGQFRAALTPLRLGLEDRLNALVGTLSSGQRQAVALAMATISKPALLLLDEHVANLDPRTAKTVLQLSDMIIHQERMTTIMVTHNMEVALRYGNRLIMMHEGKIIVDIGEVDKKALAVSDLVAAFERAAGEQLKDDTILLSRE